MFVAKLLEQMHASYVLRLGEAYELELWVHGMKLFQKMREGFIRIASTMMPI